MASMEICRICLGTNEASDMQTIFEDVIEKIEIIGGIKIEFRDDFPDKICEDCLMALHYSYNFRKLCQSNDLKLRGISDEEVVIKHESNSASPAALSSELSNDSKTNIENASEQYIEEKQEYEEHSKSLVEAATSLKALTAQRRRKPKPLDIQMCEICGNVYKRRCHLMMHMRRHAAVKPYICEICNKAFGSQSEMNRHIRIHTGDKPYKCKYCDRRFSDCSTNTRHERTHTNERPFGCATCGKTFTYSSVLKFHMMAHTGEKRYECDVCKKKFTRSHQLKHHLNTLIHKQRVKEAKSNVKDIDVTDGSDALLLSNIDLNVVVKKKTKQPQIKLSHV